MILEDEDEDDADDDGAIRLSGELAGGEADLGVADRAPYDVFGHVGLLLGGEER